MGWGTTWGTIWGGGTLAAPFTLLSAYASGASRLRLVFSTQPHLVTPIDVRDTSRLVNWTLTRTDKSQRLTLLTVIPIAGIPTDVEMVIAERWESQYATYSITGASSLTAADGVTKITAPGSATFYGTPEMIRQVERQEQLFDLLNPQTAPDQLNAGLVIGSDGDYAVEQGKTLLLKVIYREIFAVKGEFVHLAASEWGLGIQPKDLILTTAVATMQKRLENSISRQPEVTSASVSLQSSSDGILLFLIRAQTSFGPLDVSEPLDLSGVGAT